MDVATGWTGREAAALRHAHRMSIRAYAAHLGVTISTVANWDSRGEHARLRTETQQLLDLDLGRAPEDVRERFEALLANAKRVSEPPSLVGPAVALDSGGGITVTGRDHESPTTAIRAFRIADSQLGGAALYSSVVAYLRNHIGSWLVDGADEIGMPAAFNAAASMLEMAGWMAHDRGDDQIAHAHFSRALTFLAVGDDMHLRAHVFGSMSHLATHLSRPDEAVRLAKQGQDVLRHAPPHPPLLARLLALEARGAAGLGDVALPLSLLALAESELAKGGPPSQPPSPWVSQYDEASLASDASLCLRQLGDLTGTRRQAERIITLRPAHRARSRGLGHLTLANALVAQGAVDEASAVAEQALDLGLPLRSAPIARGLRALRDTLTPYRANAAVATVHARLTTALESGEGASRRLRATFNGSGS